MATPILITGSTGTVGSEVVRQLAATGATVRAAVQATSKTDRIKQAGAEPVVMDFNDEQSIAAALEGSEKAFLATPPVQNQVEISSKFIAAAKAAGLKHLVKLSAVGADTDYDTLFVTEHRKIEAAVIDSGIPYTFLRPNFFMQNMLGLDSIKSQGAFYDSSGDSKASHVHANDIAAMAVAALTQDGHEGKGYGVDGPEALSNFEVAEILSAVTGKKVTYVPVTDDDAKQSMKSVGMPDWLIEGLIGLIVMKREGLTQDVNSDVVQIIGRPLISFEQFARENVEVFK